MYYNINIEAMKFSFLDKHFKEPTRKSSFMLGLPTSMMSLRVSLALPLMIWLAKENDAETFRTLKF